MLIFQKWKLQIHHRFSKLAKKITIERIKNSNRWIQLSLAFLNSFQIHFAFSCSHLSAEERSCGCNRNHEDDGQKDDWNRFGHCSEITESWHSENGNWCFFCTNKCDICIIFIEDFPARELTELLKIVLLPNFFCNFSLLLEKDQIGKIETFRICAWFDKNISFIN